MLVRCEKVRTGHGRVDGPGRVRTGRTDADRCGRIRPTVTYYMYLRPVEPCQLVSSRGRMHAKTTN
eukprot:4281739-Prymnesium_polylepis.1